MKNIFHFGSPFVLGMLGRVAGWHCTAWPVCQALISHTESEPETRDMLEQIIKVGNLDKYEDIESI